MRSRTRLLRVPGVGDGAVVVAERADQSKHLVAFYSSPQPLDIEVLRDRLGESLPEYMVPSAFHWRERLPVTANSKIDKKTLTVLAAQLTAVEDNYDAPDDADRAAAGGRLGEGARHSAAPDRPARPFLRPRRHVAVGGEAGGQPGPGFLPQGPHQPSGPRRFGGRWSTADPMGSPSCCRHCRNRMERRPVPWCAFRTPAAMR